MKVKLNESHLARRRFLGDMIGGGTAALGVSTALPVVYYAGNFRAEPPPDFIVLEKGQHEIPPGTSKSIQYGRIPVLLIQTGPPRPELRVFVATCTHFDCTVGYRAEENVIFCACHDGVYSVDGQVVSGPPPKPLRRLFTRLDGERLILALEKENLEKAFEESDA